MTIVTPAQLAAREKAAKLAAAKAARTAKAKQQATEPSAQSDEELEAKQIMCFVFKNESSNE